MFQRLAVLLLLAGCATERAVTRPLEEPGCGPLSGIATHPTPQSGRLCVRLAFEQAPKTPATVVLVWYRPEEKARFQGGVYPPFDLIDAFLDRARVVQNVSLGTTNEFSIDYPGGDAVVLALVDVSHSFWPTMFGTGAGNFLGVSAPAVNDRAELGLTAIASRGTPSETCVGERLELVKLAAPDVAGTIGNDTSRRLCVFLPVSYAKEKSRRYPVVYLVPGFASGDTAYLRGNNDVRAKVDALAASGGGEAILVAVDTSTKHGSTYFTNSEAGGQWDAFATKLTVEIDKRYRTRADAKGRAVVGHSTGGFNAVSLGLRHPELFTVIAASAPDGLDLEAWLMDAGRVRPRWLAWSRLENAVGGIGQMLSYVAAWSPVANAFPYDLDSGAPTQPGWDAWRAQSPIRMLDDAARVDGLRKVFSSRIFLTVGRADDFGLFEPTERFDARLTELKIPHQFVPVDGGHDSKNLHPALLFAIDAMK